MVLFKHLKSKDGFYSDGHKRKRIYSDVALLLLLFYTGLPIAEGDGTVRGS